MTFVTLLNKTITISRLEAVSGDRTEYSTVTAERANIQQLDPSKALEMGMAVGQSYKMYLESGADIEEGDRIKDEDNKEYVVVAGGINDSLDVGMIQHIEIVVREVTNA